MAKHRKNALTKTEPRMQLAGRHVANRTRDRLGADDPQVQAVISSPFDLRELMRETFGSPNPFRRAAR
jgi:hypothetical protein